MKFLGLVAAIAMAAVLAVAATGPATASAADLDCSDFANQAEAQQNLLPGDPYRLDGDSDGVACEDLPCPCATGSGSAPAETPSAPAPPPPYRLGKAAARSAAKHLVRRLVRGSRGLEFSGFQGCERLANRRVDCTFSPGGRTATRRIDCQTTVAVRAAHRHPEARIARMRCRSKAIAILDYERAREAMQATANRVAGKNAAVDVSRLGRLVFWGWAEWSRPALAPGTSESCYVELRAELHPGRGLRVRAQNLSCEPV